MLHLPVPPSLHAHPPAPIFHASNPQPTCSSPTPVSSPGLPPFSLAPGTARCHPGPSEQPVLGYRGQPGGYRGQPSPSTHGCTPRASSSGLVPPDPVGVRPHRGAGGAGRRPEFCQESGGPAQQVTPMARGQTLHCLWLRRGHAEPRGCRHSRSLLTLPTSSPSPRLAPSASPYPYSFLDSIPLGRNSYKEQYVYIYR